MPLTSPTAHERAALADAVEWAWCSAWGALGLDGATQVDDTPHFLRVLTPGSPDLLLNAVLRFRHERPVQRADLEAVIAPYRVARRPLQWWVRVGAEPAGLREQLFALGMRTWDQPPGLALPLAGWQPPAAHSVQARASATPSEALAAFAVICAVFRLNSAPMRRWCLDNPAFTPYLATLDGAPVGALVRQIHAGVAGFFHVATMPNARRRGVATALMVQAMRDAQAQGATIAALTSSPQAEDIYRRLGFIPCCTFDLWMPGSTLLLDLTRYNREAG
jgi:ribosomal protein S18 acetylase RimI-like enzyme